MQSKHATGAHTGPVWQLEWLDRGSVEGEVLVSASADGRVSQWTTSQVAEPSSSHLRAYG